MSDKIEIDFITFNKIIEDSITDNIENNPAVKQIYKDEGGCFKNIVVPSVLNSENKLITMIEMLASQSVIYDKLLNNIAQFGNPELIKKCNEDINSVFSSNEE